MGKNNMNSGPPSTAAFQNWLRIKVVTGDSCRPSSASQATRVEYPQSLWVAELCKRFEELIALPYGWDGYAGRPVSFACAVFAANLLDTICVSTIPTPSLVPGADGTLQIEWHVYGYDIELDVLGPNNVVAFRIDLRNDAEESMDLSTDYSLLVRWIDDLERSQREALTVAA